ncbi:MAG: 3-hydroxyacyl-CoA dehydrogenase family protein [Bacillota bacterium]|nr:3-hydroxyacyl-CoA dehydrogenase family protein [Bacillota bacterium]
MANNERLAIIGAGTMGHSIALAAALAGFELKVWGVDEADIARGQAGISDKSKLLLKYHVIDENEARQIDSRVSFTTSMDKCIAGATYIIEAIPENLALKQELFEKLGQKCPPQVILASNTSGLSPTDIAINTAYPERTIVAHFWNPGHLIPLVEVVRGKMTSEETVDRSFQLLRQMNKKPILVKKDVLGFIGNRLQYALLREAQYLLEQGVATVEDIDDAVRYSIGRRLPVTGPFMTADMGGLEVFHSISTYLFPDLSKAQESSEDMGSLVAEGKYGQKNGAGFYQWSPEFSSTINEERERTLIEWLKRDLNKSE